MSYFQVNRVVNIQWTFSTQFQSHRCKVLGCSSHYYSSNPWTACTIWKLEHFNFHFILGCITRLCNECDLQEREREREREREIAQVEFVSHVVKARIKKKQTKPTCVEDFIPLLLQKSSHYRHTSFYNSDCICVQILGDQLSKK